MSGGGGNNVDLLKTKSLSLGFERLYSPSRLRNALTYLSFIKKVDFSHTKELVIAMPTIFKKGFIKATCHSYSPLQVPLHYFAYLFVCSI